MVEINLLILISRQEIKLILEGEEWDSSNLSRASGSNRSPPRNSSKWLEVGGRFKGWLKKNPQLVERLKYSSTDVAST